MNDDEHPDDSALTAELVDSLARVAVPERPPLAAITDRGRVHRRRRLAGLAGLGGATAAVVIALALGLTGVFGAAPARGTGTTRTAAFTLTSYINGTVALKLSQVFDPAALQRALAQHGIRALVKTGTYCSSSPAAPSPVRLGVLPIPRRARTPHRATPGTGGGQGIWESATLPVKPSQLAPMVDPISMVINPAAMPSGTELFIGFFDPGTPSSWTSSTPALTPASTASGRQPHPARTGPRPPGTDDPPAALRSANSFPADVSVSGHWRVNGCEPRQRRAGRCARRT